MPLPTKGYVTRSTRSQAELLAAPGDVLSATAEQTISELPSVSVYRMFQLGEAELSGNHLTLDQANERLKAAGLEGQLKTTEGMSPEALDILMQRKKDEIRRAELMSRSPGGVGMGAAKLGTALATGLLDPVNIATAFIPVVGEARYAKWLASARGVLGRSATRVGVGAVEGAVGAAMIEPLVYAAKTQEQADYDMLDSLLNVGFGTVFGGGLHVMAGGIGDVATAIRGRRVDINAAAARVEVAEPAQREAALRTAVNQAMVGRAVEIEPVYPKSPDYVTKTTKAEGLEYTVREGVLTDADAQLFARFRSNIQAEEKLFTTVGGGRPAEEWASRTRVAGAEGPRAVYRGTQTSLAPAHFDESSLGQASGHPSSGLGVFFTNEIEDAARYGPLVEQHYLDIRNPKTIPVEEIPSLDTMAEYVAFRERLRAEGYDGIVIDASHLDGPVQYVAFDADQVLTRAEVPRTADARNAAERLASPESDITADVRAAELADEQLANVPRGTDPIAEQEALIADAMKELKDVARINGADIKEDLAELDELVKQAETYGKAARAAVLCGLGH